MTLAHFTAAELPGTFAVLVLGIAIGAAAVQGRADALSLAIVGFCGLAAVGSVLDHFDGVAAEWKVAIDVIFLLGGLTVLTLLVREARSPVPRRRSTRRPAPRH